MKKTSSYSLAASLICGDMLNLRKDIKALEKAKIDYIHFDVMDGVFVPRFGLMPELLNAVNKETDIPINVHMMMIKPEMYLEHFVKAGADIITFHPETTNTPYQIITLLKQYKVKVGIALNPGTPLNVLDYILDEVHSITIMAINPGIIGQKMLPLAYKKIADIRERLGDSDIMVEIDGGVTPETAPKMLQAGATSLVCGTGTIYQPPAQLDVKIKALRKTIDSELRTHETNL